MEQGLPPACGQGSRAGKQRLVGYTERQVEGRQVSEMRVELGQLKQLVAELSLKNCVLKKKLAAHGIVMRQMMRRSPTEKREIIDLVEHSALPVARTPVELDAPRSPPRTGARGSFYRWYQQFQQEGEKGLEPQPSNRRQFWNRLPAPVCDQIVRLALAQPEKSARQPIWLFADQEGLSHLGIKHIPAAEAL
jgi:transposase-like protein